MPYSDSVFFSVIVPVYNVESYLNECIQSILIQDFSDYEIILVDDGSIDRSAEMCDKFAQQNARIKVIHQKNKGLSEARNTGFKNCSGKYILFVDADDYISMGSLKKIHDLIIGQGEVDVVFLEMVKFFPDGTEEPMGDGYIKECILGRNPQEVLQHISAMPKFPGSACSKAVRRALIDESLYFTSGLISEDVDWCYRLFGRAEKYAYLDTPYYYYRQERTGYISNSVSKKTIDSIFWIIEKWAKKYPIDEYQKAVNAFVSYQYTILMFNLSQLDKETSKLYFDRAKKYSWILKFGKSRKIKFVYTVSRFIGVKNTSRLLKIYKKR